MAKIDEHRTIIVGGMDADRNKLSSGFIYDVRTQQSTPLRNDMPAALYGCCVVAIDAYVFVIGGFVKDRNVNTACYVNTVYRLCLESEEWTTMAPMGNTRFAFAAVLKGKYIYVFGGYNGRRRLSSTERYCIDNNTWEDLPDNPNGPCSSHCAVTTTGSEIYIVGGRDTRSVHVFDTGPSLTWKTPTYLRHMPEERWHGAAVVVKKKYLVVIGGFDEDDAATASCLIYDIWCNRWSSTPASMDMIKARDNHTAEVLDRKIFVAGGAEQDENVLLASVECIEADALLDYAPLHYPLPMFLFDRVLQIGKLEMKRLYSLT